MTAKPKKRRGRPTTLASKSLSALAIFNAVRPFVGYRRAMADVQLLFGIADSRAITGSDPHSLLPVASPEDIRDAVPYFEAGFARGAVNADPLHSGRHVLVTALFALESMLEHIRTNTDAADLPDLIACWPAPLRTALLHQTRRPPLRPRDKITRTAARLVRIASKEDLAEIRRDRKRAYDARRNARPEIQARRRNVHM